MLAILRAHFAITVCKKCPAVSSRLKAWLPDAAAGPGAPGVRAPRGLDRGEPDSKMRRYGSPVLDYTVEEFTTYRTYLSPTTSVEFTYLHCTKLHNLCNFAQCMRGGCCTRPRIWHFNNPFSSLSLNRICCCHSFLMTFSFPSRRDPPDP